MDERFPTNKHLLLRNPVGKRSRNDFVFTSMRRQFVPSTSEQSHFDVICPLGRILRLKFKIMLVIIYGIYVSFFTTVIKMKHRMPLQTYININCKIKWQCCSLVCMSQKLWPCTMTIENHKNVLFLCNYQHALKVLILTLLCVF